MSSGAGRRDRPDGRRRPRRGLVALLLVLGSAAALVGSFAVWLDRQALSPSGWQTASSQLIANPQIRQGVGTFAVDELYARTNVAGLLRSALPPALAQPALRMLRSLGLRLAAGILASPEARVNDRAAGRRGDDPRLRSRRRPRGAGRGRGGLPARPGGLISARRGACIRVTLAHRGGGERAGSDRSLNDSRLSGAG